MTALSVKDENGMFLFGQVHLGKGKVLRICGQEDMNPRDTYD